MHGQRHQQSLCNSLTSLSLESTSQPVGAEKCNRELQLLMPFLAIPEPQSLWARLEAQCVVWISFPRN